MFRDIWTFYKKWVLIGIGVLVTLLLITVSVIKVVNKNKSEEVRTTYSTTSNSEDDATKEFNRIQERMTEKYGKAPKGMYYNEDGELVPEGNPKYTPEEVASTYLRALSTMNLENAQRYSYKTSVLKSLTKFYDTKEQYQANANFKKEMYKQVLLSIQPLNVQDTATFAVGKSVVTMNVKLIDLSNKDFWKEDTLKIFKNIFKYRRAESDSSKSKDYVYDYVLDYYKSESPKLVRKTISLTLEKGVTGGWVVTNDDELDAIAQYRDGEVVVSNIISAYDDWASSIDPEEREELLTKSGKIDGKQFEQQREELEKENSNSDSEVFDE